MKYLLDPDGDGKSIIDIRDNGTRFETSFSNHMGINIHTYEYDFYDYADNYLSANQQHGKYPKNRFTETRNSSDQDKK